MTRQDAVSDAGVAKGNGEQVHPDKIDYSKLDVYEATDKLTKQLYPLMAQPGISQWSLKTLILQVLFAQRWKQDQNTLQALKREFQGYLDTYPDASLTVAVTRLRNMILDGH